MGCGLSYLDGCGSESIGGGRTLSNFLERFCINVRDDEELGWNRPSVLAKVTELLACPVFLVSFFQALKIHQTTDMSRLSALALTLAVFLTLTCADHVPIERAQTVDIKEAAKQLVSQVRHVATQAKNGIYLESLRNDVLDLQTTASDLIGDLPNEVSECDVKSTIKMAAAGTGSHEVLTLLLADDILSVLNGRLTLSLAILEHVAQQMEDELSLSTDVGPHLTAIVFGTNVTMDIIDTADNTVKTVAAKTSSDTNNKDYDNKRVRRQLRTHANLGRGWSVGLRGVQWESRNGRYTFNTRPTFSGFRPNGVRASFTIRF